MNPATPNDPKPAAPAAPAPAPEPPKPVPHGAPIPARFGHAVHNQGGGSKFFSGGRNARQNIPPAAMRQQRHGRHDG